MHRQPRPLDIVHVIGAERPEIVEDLDAHHIMLRGVCGGLERMIGRPRYQCLRLVGVAATRNRGRS